MGWQIWYGEWSNSNGEWETGNQQIGFCQNHKYSQIHWQIYTKNIHENASNFVMDCLADGVALFPRKEGEKNIVTTAIWASESMNLCDAYKCENIHIESGLMQHFIVFDAISNRFRD